MSRRSTNRPSSTRSPAHRLRPGVSTGGEGPPPSTSQGPDRADRCRLLERPGLYRDFDDWRRLSGPGRLPPEPARGEDEQLLAGWQELSFWWRFAFEASLEPDRLHVPRLCVKLVSESARVRLWLEHGVRLSDRRDVLRTIGREYPDELAIADAMLDALDRTHQLPERLLEAATGCLLRQTQAVARLLTQTRGGAG